MGGPGKTARERTGPPVLAAFTTWATEKTRNMDTDQFGHVNHAAMATLLEGARIDLVFTPELASEASGIDLLVASLTMVFHRELAAPGMVRIGSVVRRIGTSSLDIHQGIFDDGECVASAEAVCVLLDRASRRPARVGDRMRAHLMP